MYAMYNNIFGSFCKAFCKHVRKIMIFCYEFLSLTVIVRTAVLTAFTRYEQAICTTHFVAVRMIKLKVKITPGGWK